VDDMNKKRDIILLIFLIALFLAVNYSFIDGKLQTFLEDRETGFVERIVDGDTAIINGNSTRFLGINTPEKGEKYYQEAKDFLGSLILNKTVELEYGKDKIDLYGRKLAYIILDGKNVNVEQVRNGFANIFVYDKDRYTNDLENAWNECITNGKNLCEKSKDKCADCIELKELDIGTQEIIFYNNCNFECDSTNWDIKDEGRKKLNFGKFILEGNKELKVVVGDGTNSEEELFWRGEEYVWTSTGDTLFLRDDIGDLVLWEEMGR